MANINPPKHSYVFVNRSQLSNPQKFFGWLDSRVRDKNQRPVYEGSIVRVNDSDETGEVKFIDGAFTVNGQFIFDLSNGELEVIGHIAEG